jgi:hypothetical protein
MAVLRVHCESERYFLRADLSMRGDDLRGLISARHHFSPGVRIVHRGRVLPSDATLALSGVSAGALLVVVPSCSCASLRIRLPAGFPPFSTPPLPLTAPVSDVRALAAQRLALPPARLHLVHRGRLLEDPFSLAFYGIADGSTVYAVSVKRSPAGAGRPSALLQALREKMAAFVSAPPAAQGGLAAAITELLETPVLQAYARVDADARTATDDAVLLLGGADAGALPKHTAVIALVNDRLTTNYEATRAGRRMLREAMLAPVARAASAVAPARLDFESRISEEPVPVWWSVAVRHFEYGRQAGVRSPSIRERFSREVRLLMRMGFSDEVVILIALKETSGNVPEAARLLMRNVPARGADCESG